MKPYILLLALVSLAGITHAQYYSNIEFVENKGQWNAKVKFQGEVPAGAFYIRNTGFTVLQHHPKDFEQLTDAIHGHGHGKTAEQPSKPNGGKKTLRSHAYNVDFIGASENIEIIPDKALPNYNNYFIGNDPSKWAAECKIYQGVTLKNVYPNIDVRYYTESGRLKYDIIARPGAKLDQIAMRYEGVSKLEVKNKELVIGTSVGELRELSPYTYQFNGKDRKDLNAKFSVKGNIVKFDIKDYDVNATIVIDPVLVFCSFSGSTGDNWGYTATFGPDGSMFGGGTARASGFPVSPGAFQTNWGGGVGEEDISDIAIIKLNPSGSNRIYATYIGGSGNEQPHSLIVDGAGNLVLAGRTNSTNYPTTGGGLEGPGGSWDIVITKLNPAGSALVGSKKIGGSGEDGVNITSTRGTPTSLQQNYGDDGRSEVMLDNNGNIYVASCTRSTDFPVRGNGFQAASGGQQDGVLIKMNSTVSTVLFSTYIGGSGDDAAYVLSIGPTGNIYVAGGTNSINFPGTTTAGVMHQTNQGAIDGFVAIINNNGTALQRSTYIGTSGIDQVYGIQFDRKGYPYIMGQTTGNWVVVNAIFVDANAKQFISKLQPDLSGNVYSTTFGKSATVPSISPVAFLVDRCENVYVSGWSGTFGTYSTSGGSGLPVTNDAIQSSTDGQDFYFFVMKRDATLRLYGSFFGQNGGLVDHVDGGTSRFDDNGVIYQAICANCGQPPKPVFPTTPGAWSTQNPSNNCNLAMVKIAFNLAGVGAGVRSAIDGSIRDTAGCVPLTVDFTDTVQNAQSYEWNFGDGSPQVNTSSPTTSHEYTSTGTFQVMLVAIDSATCNIRDTSYLTIRVGDIQATLNFNPVKLNPCDSFKFRFDNLSSAPAIRPFTATSFIWDFGDQSPRITAGINPVFHSYSAPGTYNVKLILADTGYCNSPDSIEIQVRVASLVKAQFETPPIGCVPYDAVFNNTSLAGQTFTWYFGDGSTSNAISPTYTYTVPGTYTVKLVAVDSGTCNITDSVEHTITVFGIPTANFTYAPNPPVDNTPTTFTNLASPDAVRFKWEFGDGDSLITTSRAPVIHQYNATGTYNACLTVYNAANCEDQICQPVDVTIIPLLDVPNAFTPAVAGPNNIVYVRGFGIGKMKFTIWNRQGLKVFETTDYRVGWDGRYKGVIQPMDVYAYTLEAEFTDGTKASKKGDITLIR